MALGIESNSVAPQLIQNSGSALVQGIRQIGQQISGHLTEMQTKRDLAALGQEAQALNVESNEFPTQLAQLVTRHPLAARDERGLMALSAMGKAHGQWQATEAEARAFNRAMAMQTRRTQDARTAAQEQEDRIRNRPVNVAGVGLVDPNDIDEVTQQPRVLVKAQGRTDSTPFQHTPAGPFDQRTGTYGTPPPIPSAVKPASPIAKLTQRRLAIKDQLDILERDITEGTKKYKEIEVAEKEAEAKREKARGVLWDGDTKTPEAERSKLQTEKTVIGSLVDEKRKRRDALMLELQKIADAAMVDEAEAGILPPLPANAAAAPTGPVPVKSAAEAAKLPKGTQYQTPDGRIFTRN